MLKAQIRCRLAASVFKYPREWNPHRPHCLDLGGVHRYSEKEQRAAANIARWNQARNNKTRGREISTHQKCSAMFTIMMMAMVMMHSIFVPSPYSTLCWGLSLSHHLTFRAARPSRRSRVLLRWNNDGSNTCKWNETCNAALNWLQLQLLANFTPFLLQILHLTHPLVGGALI